MIISMADAKFNKTLEELTKIRDNIERQIQDDIMQRTNRRVDRAEWVARVANGCPVSVGKPEGFALQIVR